VRLSRGSVPAAEAARSAAGAGTGPALVACVVATIAFSVYTRTLLPGVDLGDTAGFQAAVLWPETSARQAYPLYFDLARPFVLALSPDNPARGLNLFSAVTAGVAVGLLALLTALVTRSLLSGAIAGLLLAFSHTFWTQSVIAEVYALHLMFVGCCLLVLRAYQQRPTRGRLALFFAVYALSFGNHLSMILLMVPFALFLFAVHPRPRELLRPRTIAMAIGLAALAALTYAPNFLFIWTNINAPPGWPDRVATFWFDATKADWRGSMMLGVDRSELVERIAMWLWDARLQFGIAGLLGALVGMLRLSAAARPWALLVGTAYVINTVFSVTYNVGDPHVFFLPGHLLTALAIAAAAAPWRRQSASRLTSVLGIVVMAYALWHAWDTWPSVDRHDDRRAEALVARVTAGISDNTAVLLSDMNWQSENAILYAARYERKQLAWGRLGDVMLHLPFLINDNQTIRRDIVLAGTAASRVVAAYGSLFDLVPDDSGTLTLAGRVAQIPRGAPYVMTLLEPAPDDHLDGADFDAAMMTLAGEHTQRRSNARFQVWAGAAGERQSFHQESDRPFRKTFSVLGDSFSVRMESWLPFETFRRAGFGHVLRGRDHLLTIERGVSLVWFGSDGSPVITYAAGLYAPQRRVRIPAGIPQQVARRSGAILGTALLPHEFADGP
jgi:hypothetical protein